MLISAGFDAPDAAVERGEIFFENLQEVRGGAGVAGLCLFTSAWSVSEYVFGVRTSKLTRHLGVKSKEYVKQTRH
jgi:hypothetical protein